jgi:hypothetical protein
MPFRHCFAGAELLIGAGRGDDRQPIAQRAIRDRDWEALSAQTESRAACAPAT